MSIIYKRLIRIIEEYWILRTLILVEIIAWAILPLLPTTSDPIYEFGYVEYVMVVIGLQCIIIPFLAAVGLVLGLSRGKPFPSGYNNSK